MAPECRYCKLKNPQSNNFMSLVGGGDWNDGVKEVKFRVAICDNCGTVMKRDQIRDLEIRINDDSDVQVVNMVNGKEVVVDIL